LDAVVILSRQEQEYLLRAVESGLRVASMRQFFLWTQGQLQTLLPHQVMVALHFAPSGALRRLAMLELGEDSGALAGFGPALREAGIDSVLVHGTGQLADGASVFLLFGLPMRPGPRHAYFLELLLAHLHLALLRLPAPEAGGAGLPSRPLSARETEIVGWLREGKSNEEMAQILGISALTVKNHLQRIYRLLGVGNRAHALARCLELRLLA
jgi:DNA-binding CsgD family transcriptional regulator